MENTKSAAEPKKDLDSLGQDNPAQAMEREKIKEAKERAEKADKDAKKTEKSEGK